jgi:hypothetical protein
MKCLHCNTELTKILVYARCCQTAHLKDGEAVIEDYGSIEIVEQEDAQCPTCLNYINGHVKDLKGLDLVEETYAIVKWCDDDIAEKLERNGFDKCQANIDRVRQYEDSIKEAMTEAGWVTIDAIITDIGAEKGLLKTGQKNVPTK